MILRKMHFSFVTLYPKEQQHNSLSENGQDRQHDEGDQWHQIRSGIAFVTITGLAELDAEVLFIPLWALAHGKLVTLVETGSGVRSHAGN